MKLLSNIKLKIRNKIINILTNLLINEFDKLDSRINDVENSIPEPCNYDKEISGLESKCDDMEYDIGKCEDRISDLENNIDNTVCSECHKVVHLRQ